MTVISGSARGARVGGAALGSSGLALCAMVTLSAGPHWLTLVAGLVFVFWIVRPWFMGVGLTRGGIRVISWYRVYELTEEEVGSVDAFLYAGLVARSAVGFVPLIGSIRMMRVTSATGRERWFPSTVGRQKTVESLVGVVNAHLEALRAET